MTPGRIAKAVVDFFIAATLLALIILAISGISALLHVTSQTVRHWGSNHSIGTA